MFEVFSYFFSELVYPNVNEFSKLKKHKLTNIEVFSTTSFSKFMLFAVHFAR